MNQPHSGHAQPARFERTWVLRDERDALERVQSEVGDALRGHGFDEAAAFAIRLALEEAMINGFRHGNKGSPDKSVTVDCLVDGGGVELVVTDEGEGFDPASVPDPTADENIEIPSGRGIMLMRAYMTSVEYLPPGNRLRIVFRRGAAAS